MPPLPLDLTSPPLSADGRPGSRDWHREVSRGHPKRGARRRERRARQIARSTDGGASQNGARSAARPLFQERRDNLDDFPPHFWCGPECSPYWEGRRLAAQNRVGARARRKWAARLRPSQQFAGGEDFGYFAQRMVKRVRIPPASKRTVEPAPRGPACRGFRSFAATRKTCVFGG
jgi:hypothetical protein